ncbi:ROK family protein [Brachyspira pilosicoli]|uniref:Transcriptional regulator/sugar kinase n=2 Tax=Brachyspira pilosicoli TaxID=52584 RepID=D8IF02_BRAP9|nr:ROK family protein [Brachyspira pilosicoli]ADK31725.1 transcriptional regulator/sugar kinase [Brachyspira pilosicoli 95/1000]AGA66531.1 transcriptional regulator/sugar kinase [Brachyspira pilosicoli P43/6/78]MBW5383180.1 ROK family protein [Brachyspira pilosicoli]PLV63962.1 transcriptional regulator [Brachyspira pilosicoli SP16]WIH80332.1 ROK family protein [Brachyspira pilosicoli]
MKDAVIALDIGGTSIKGAIINEEGNILYKDSFNIEANFTSEEHKTNIANIIKKLLENMPSEYNAIGIGLDCPGVMNSETLHMGGAENVPGLHGIKFSDIGDLFDLPIKTANDASMAALGEAKYGSGKDKEYKSVMFITLGTGVGGGFVFNGKLFTGSLGGAGEVGHVFVVPDGDKCNCGSSGCIERYASATGFIAMAKQKIHKNVVPTTLTYEELEKGKAKAIFDAAKKGDALAKETIAECSYYLGMSIAQALNMLDLDLVLIGGGLCKDFDMMIEHIKRGVNNYGLRMMVRNLEIKPASLGNDAGVLGCAAMFFRN